MESLTTSHKVQIGDARDLTVLQDASIDLVVTSPPYPMVEMWDDCFAALAPDSAQALQAGEGMVAFEAMHRALDAVWAECLRVLRPGGFTCINIGDATRTLGGEFCLYPNHARIGSAMLRLGFTPLPDILWRKPTNAPNKFMGSGMLPAGAYVTYEHEYVLIFRKGGKRRFDGDERKLRSASAFFWEERNVWFSDLWMGLTGTGQALSDEAARKRSGAFPFEVPYRLILMYSLYGDTVLDPFSGTGTTAMAAVAAGRDSVSVERELSLERAIRDAIGAGLQAGARRCRERSAAHQAFVAKRLDEGKAMKHVSEIYGWPVTTTQETNLVLMQPVRQRQDTDPIVVEHEPYSSERPQVPVGPVDPGEPQLSLLSRSS